jgi:hypothetical protein
MLNRGGAIHGVQGRARSRSIAGGTWRLGATVDRKSDRNARGEYDLPECHRPSKNGSVSSALSTKAAIKVPQY